MECGQDLRQAQERIPILDVDVIISACKLALEGIVSKRKDSVYHSGSSPVGGGEAATPQSTRYKPATSYMWRRISRSNE
jgi:hypothetical protein